MISVTKAAQIGLFTAGQGNITLDVEVLIENTSRADRIPYNPFYFKVKDADSNPYPTALTSLEPSLKTGNLDNGEKVRGHIAFEVNARVNPLIFSFEPNVYLSDYQVIRFNLSQQSTHPVAVPTFLPPAINGKMGEYEYTTALVALDPGLKSGDLAPGEKAGGHVAFEVRKEAKGFILAYEPVVLFKDYEEISIDLGK